MFNVIGFMIKNIIFIRYYKFCYESCKYSQ